MKRIITAILLLSISLLVLMCSRYDPDYSNPYDPEGTSFDPDLYNSASSSSSSQPLTNNFNAILGSWHMGNITYSIPDASTFRIDTPTQLLLADIVSIDNNDQSFVIHVTYDPGSMITSNYYTRVFWTNLTDQGGGAWSLDLAVFNPAYQWQSSAEALSRANITNSSTFTNSVSSSSSSTSTSSGSSSSGSVPTLTSVLTNTSVFVNSVMRIAVTPINSGTFAYLGCENQGGDYQGISRTFNDDGTQASSVVNFGVNNTTVFSSLDAVSLDSGEYAVLYSRATTDAGIWMQIFYSSGTLKDNFTVDGVSSINSCSITAWSGAMFLCWRGNSWSRRQMWDQSGSQTSVQTVFSDPLQSLDSTTLNDGEHLAAFTDSLNNNLIYTKYDNSGNPTGTPQTNVTSIAANATALGLSDSKYVLAYTDGGLAAISIFLNSGSTITNNIYLNSGNDISGLSLVELDTGIILAVYRDLSNSYGKCEVYNSIGTRLIPPTYFTSQNIFQAAATQLTSGRVVIAYTVSGSVANFQIFDWNP